MATKPDTTKKKSTKAAKTPETEKVETGAPVERYHGEKTDGERVGDPGDLEEETLDRDAPFNKSYGLIDEDGSGPQR